MRIRVVSDGTTAGTKVFDEDTGKEITGTSDTIISEIHWEAVANDGLCKMNMDFALFPLDVTINNPEVRRVKCIHCGHNLKVSEMLSKLILQQKDK